MQKNEFEVLYGRHVSADEYSNIERAYMAAPTIDKERFCKEWRALRLGQSQLVAELAERVECLLVSRDQYKHSAEKREEALMQAKQVLEKTIADKRELAKECDALKDETRKLIYALIESGNENSAEAIVGRRAVVGVKAALGLEFNGADRELIAEVFNR